MAHTGGYTGGRGRALAFSGRQSKQTRGALADPGRQARARLPGGRRGIPPPSHEQMDRMNESIARAQPAALDRRGGGADEGATGLTLLFGPYASAIWLRIVLDTESVFGRVVHATRLGQIALSSRAVGQFS